MIAKIARRYAIEWVGEAHPFSKNWQDDLTNAAFDGKKMYFRRDVTHIEALEEFLHGTQNKIPKLKDVADNYPLYELHVKDFMV